MVTKVNVGANHHSLNALDLQCLESLMKSTTGDVLLVGRIMIRPYVIRFGHMFHDFGIS